MAIAMIVTPVEVGSPLIEPLCAHFAREWPEWARTQGPAQMRAAFESDPSGRLPVVLAAVEGTEPIGTIALRPFFAAEPMEHTPWVRGWWVRADRRGQGVGRSLLAAVEDEAWRRGHRRLYVATTHVESTLVHLGWKVFHRLDHAGEPMAWLRKDVGPRRA